MDLLIVLLRIVAALWLLTAGFTGWLGSQKNRDPMNWFLLGLLGGIIALIALVGAPAGKFRGAEK